MAKVISNKVKSFLLSIGFIKKTYYKLVNQNQLDDFVVNELNALSSGSSILDAGCGHQRFRKHCSHLDYKCQDFAQYTVDLKKSIGSIGVGGTEGYDYGKLDFVGDIWSIDAPNQSFDAILCTEVFEHIPYPNETLSEFSRLLKGNGTLILSAPSNCLRHMDPYFFYTGFSDRWFEKFLNEYGFKIEKLIPVGDYYSWLSLEMVRTSLSHGFFAKLMLFPAFLYLNSRQRTQISTDTLCMGYHILAKKIA